MAYDPTLPVNSSSITATELRGQFGGLFDLIQAIPTPPTPITGFMVDATNTLPAGENASVVAGVESPVVHCIFNIPRGADGLTGPAGTSFTNFVADPVTTLSPGSDATVSVSFDGTAVHLAFGLPRGESGAVTGEQFDNAINGTALNPNAVNSLGLVLSDPPTTAELQQVADKLDELIGALRRV